MHPVPQGRQSHQGHLAFLALALLAAGCGGHARRPAISVTPRVSLSTAPVDIRVTGLKPHEAATITVTSTDADGRVFTSHQTYNADGHGVVHAGATTIAAMTPASGDPFYAWSRSRTKFGVVATQGRTRLTTTFMREQEPVSTTNKSLTVARDGFFGFYAAPRRDAKRPALLVFGGSEGGLTTDTLAASLAARGYPALAIAYFKEPGLPSKLENIPLEYFVRAIRWLDRQPQVSRHHVFVLGISRGSEAAQLLGVHFPGLVDGVVASVPSDYVGGCYVAPPGRCSGPAWTLDGRPIAFAGIFRAPPGIVELAADRIPDEHIRGPILFACAGLDFTWPSCDYSRDAMKHLTRDRYEHRLLEAHDAGHFVGALVPDDPGGAVGYLGAKADERGRERVWPALLAFLARNG
ncbi:MAG TPA: acyl-CoA thioester hydrolase/BAAT C-terminal domain-containing protein [Gaiellaceae bacterium]|nr:acyl-CoA thioester hydrolase/BAAT C-terminal domain-containing protein [Gaiellaceae bacterium]